MESGTVLTSIFDKFLQDENNIEKLQRYIAKLYRKIVQPEDLARVLYSKYALDNLSDTLRMYKQRNEVALTHYITEQAFKKRKFAEYHGALQESGNDHVAKDISKWIEKQENKQKQEPRTGAKDPKNTSARTTRSSSKISETSSLSSSSNTRETSTPKRPRPEITSKSLRLLVGPTGDEAVLNPEIKSNIRSTVPGLFVATFKGLIALNLQTLEATTITSERASAVAVNHNLTKVYWVERRSQIMCSNYDGSDKKVIVPAAGERIYALAIDDTSGNVYFGLFSSGKIKTCNERGKNCTVLLSNSFLLKNPWSIALDSKRRDMYLTGVAPSSGFICANMDDGDNVRIIAEGLGCLFGIALDNNSSNVLYWTVTKEDAIGTIDINGRKKRKLIQLEPKIGATRIQVDDHKIYFNTNKGVHSANKNNGGEMKTILKAEYVIDLALFNAPV